MMTNFSHPTYELARTFALQAAAGALMPPMSLPMATVILASTALESFLNEEIEMTKGSPENVAWAESLQESRGLSLEAKWVLFLRLWRGKTFDTGRQPYADFALLIELRNVLVYRAARFYGADKPFPGKRVEGLRARFRFTPAEEGTFVSWDSQVMNANCARWACNTAAALRAEHCKLVGRGPGAAWEPVPEPETR